MHASPTTVEEAPPVEATDEQLVATYGGLEARLWSMAICIDRLCAASAP